MKISIIGGGTHGPFNLMLRRNGVDPDKDIKLVEVSFSLSEDAVRAGRVDAVNMNQPFAARSEAKRGLRKLFALSEALPNIVHIVEACRKDFVDKNPDLVRAYVKDITAALKKALANRAETMKVAANGTRSLAAWRSNATVSGRSIFHGSPTRSRSRACSCRTMSM